MYIMFICIVVSWTLDYSCYNRRILSIKYENKSLTKIYNDSKMSYTKTNHLQTAI